jgi:ABC-2 type transport system permease protein
MRGVDLGLGEMLGAGLAALPQVGVFLGASVLAFGAAPRLTGAVASGAAALALMLQLVGESLDAPGWVTWISPFAHAADAPLDPVSVAAAIAMVLVGLALAAAGLHAFARRDLVGA